MTRRTALVAAATSGLGLEIARRLVADDYSVSICGSRLESLQRALDQLNESAPGAATGSVCDLRSSSDIKAWVSNAVETGDGVIDALVVNTGGPKPGRFAELDDDDWSEAVDLVLMSAIRLARAARPHMADGSSVVFMTSSAVREPQLHLLSSSVLRSGVVALAKSLADEWAPQIRVNHVYPGRINTTRVQELDERRASREQRTLEDVTNESQAAIPMGRYGEPKEFAAAVAFLLSVDASYITGSTLAVDGGMIGGIH